MSGKKYITICEAGSLNFHCGEMPPEVFEAADEGLYDIIDITNPERPMRYCDEGWTSIDPLVDDTQ